MTKEKEYKIRSQTEEERKAREDLISSYDIKLNLSDEEKERLHNQVFTEFQGLKDEREELGLEKKWAERERQYDGDLKDNKTLAFNLHVHQSKIKVEAIVRAINEAFMDSDPKIDCTPRPDSARKDGYEVAARQSEFLDFALDEEVCPETAFVKILRCATKKFVGIGKLRWAYRTEPRKREETYVGKNIPIGMTPDGQPLMENEGLKRFLNAYPDAVETYPGLIKRLLKEETINIVVEYEDTIDNNPKLEYIKLENFYVRNDCEYWLGLRFEHCVVERIQYTYWELLEKEENDEFENVESLFWNKNETKGEATKIEDYMTKIYDVLEVTTYFKKEGDSESKKIKCWYGEEKEEFLGAEVWNHYGFDIDYIPFYLIHNEFGFYGDARSVMYDIKDSNIAQDALLNLSLHGTLVRNLVTPIVESGSEIEAMFLDNHFETGKPLPVDNLTDDVNKAVGFVQWPPMDLNAMLALDEKLKRGDSDVTRVSDLTSGRVSVLDPSAPAAKTIALLEQSGVGIRDYIRIFLPSFNIFAWMLLQMYYQMSNEDEKKFKVVGKASAVTGENPFRSISREEMVVKTNIQARAASFAFDKLNEKKEALACYQVVMADPYARQQPMLMYQALKTLLDTFGDRWKSISSKHLATPEQFQQQMQQVAVQAMQSLLQQASEQSKITGAPVSPQELMKVAPGAIAQAQAEAFNPSLREENVNAK